jgi:putative ABC transport system permease protein
VGLVRSQLRSAPGRGATLIAGISAAAAAFTVLCMNASAVTVQISGRLPGVSPRRAYDILVRLPSQVAPHNDAGALARPTDLAELSGGITLAQYHTISQLPGVQVAAPLTMVGYVPLTVVAPVTVPAAQITSAPALFTVTADQRSEAGLSTVTQQNVGSTYVTSDRLTYSSGEGGLGPGDIADAPGGTKALVCPRTRQSPPPPVFSADAERRTACWSTVTGPEPDGWAGRPPAMVSVPLAWTFLLPLVAVDPAEEARLLHLDRAVTQGGYLPDTTVAGAGPVPVIMASSIDDDSVDSLTVSQLPPAAARQYGAGLTTAQIDNLLDTTSGQAVGTQQVTAAQAYRELLTYVRASGPATVAAYWSTTPAHYTIASDGALTPRPVPSDPGAWAGPYALTGRDAAPDGVTGTGFRVLVPHVARSFTDGAATSSAAVLRAVGVFDPARIASSAATPSPYLGERLSGADASSRRLLGGAVLAADGNPAAYPSPGATLVMPLTDIGAFTASSAYTNTDARAPIGSIRVRVSGATGDDALSQARVRMVAQEIVRATGLQVDVTLAASAATRTIDLAASHDGRPALQLSEIWYRSDTRTTVSATVDPRSVALSAAVLLVGSAFVASGSPAALHRRRRELATLRALGWPRRHVAWQLVREFALISATAGLLAVPLAYLLEAAISRSAAASGWPLLSVPAAAVMTIAAAWWQVRRVTAEPVSATTASGIRARLRARPAGVFGHAAQNLLRDPRRTALGAVLITGASAVLGLELTVRWVFGGVLVGSWLGLPFSWQDDPVDLAAVLTIVALATVTMTDISFLSAGQRAGELRTLRAIGWPARGVARLAVGEAALLGLVGGVAASVLDVAGVLALVHRPPAGLAMMAIAIIGAGVTLSMIATSLSAAVERVTRALA